MRVERLVTAMRGRRTVVALLGLVALVIAGAGVALVDDPAEQAARTGAVAGRDEAAVAPQVGGAPVVTGDSAALSATGSGTSGGGGNAASRGPTPVAPTKPAEGTKVVKTANLRVEVGKGRFQAAFQRATRVAEEHGGFVASSSQATVDDKASEGTVTIRVPADRFEAARTALAGLGTVEHQELSGQDVTAQIVDYDARIRNLQAQEQALNTLLSRARTVGEVLDVQGQLFSVRQQIEQLQAERTNLDTQASMATITATVFEPGAALTRPAEPRTGLARSWERAWDGALAVVGGMVIVLGYLVPLAVLALLGWAAWRLTHRRRTVVSTAA